jgi:hypothetical protein
MLETSPANSVQRAVSHAHQPQRIALHVIIQVHGQIYSKLCVSESAQIYIQKSEAFVKNASHLAMLVAVKLISALIVTAQMVLSIVLVISV